MADGGESLRVGLGARHRDRRVRRDHEGDSESDDRGAEQNRRPVDDSPYDVRNHFSKTLRQTAASSCPAVMLLNREHPVGAKLAREPEFGAFAMASRGAAVRRLVICIWRRL